MPAHGGSGHVPIYSSGLAPCTVTLYFPTSAVVCACNPWGREGERGREEGRGGEERGEGEEGGERAPICSLLAFTKQGISGAIWTQIELVLGQMKALDVGNTLRVSNLQGTAK